MSVANQLGLPVGAEPLLIEAATGRQEVTDKVGVGPVACQLQLAFPAERHHFQLVHPLQIELQMEGAILLRQAVERCVDPGQGATEAGTRGKGGALLAELQLGHAVDAAGIGEHQTQVGFACHQLVIPGERRALL